MAPKPASTAGKAPASTASKAPAKPTEGAKAAKKTSSKPTGEASDEKKKRRKVRKETYSSYIYKGELSTLGLCDNCKIHEWVSAEAGAS
jgi:histone H2B